MKTQINDFRLDEAQLGAALALAAVKLHPHSPIANLQITASPASLQGTGLLDDSQKLTSGALQAMQILAHPGYKLICVLNDSGNPAWKEHIFLRPEEDRGPFLSLEKNESRYKLLLFSSVDEMSGHIEQILALPDLVAPSGAPSAKLNLVSYVALLAAADALQSTRLRSRLARSDASKPVLNPVLLETELNTGLSHKDTRWAITASQRICSTDLKTTAGQMKNGLAELKTSGLVSPVSRGYGLSPAGSLLAGALNDLVNTIGFKLTLARNGGSITISQIGIFRCASAIWIAEETNFGKDASIRLRLIGRSEAHELIRKFIDARELAQAILKSLEQRRCPSCDKPVSSNVRFCPGCGADLSALAPLTCVQCGARNKPGAAFCTGCGNRFQSPAVAAEKELRCSNPTCGKVISAGRKFCSACGTPVK